MVAIHFAFFSRSLHLRPLYLVSRLPSIFSSFIVPALLSVFAPSFCYLHFFVIFVFLSPKLKSAAAQCRAQVNLFRQQRLCGGVQTLFRKFIHPSPADLRALPFLLFLKSSFVNHQLQSSKLIKRYKDNTCQ